MRLLLDAMCGGLRVPLRMCGHDAVYALDQEIEDDDRLLELAREKDRTLVTRDRELAGRGNRAILLDSKDVDEQLQALLIEGIDLTLEEPPTRCGRCNGLLTSVPVDASLPANVPDDDSVDVWQCTACSQHFWKGSHWADVRKRLADVRCSVD